MNHYPEQIVRDEINKQLSAYSGICSVKQNQEFGEENKFYQLFSDEDENILHGLNETLTA